MKNKALSPLLEYTKTSSYDDLKKITEDMCEHKSAQGNIGFTFSLFETNMEKDRGFKFNSGKWIVDHPDIWSNKPVFEGKCVFYSDYWRIADHKVESDIIENPTWKDIIVEANRQLIDPEDGSTACLFLEGFYTDEDYSSDNIKYIELVWGS